MQEIKMQPGLMDFIENGSKTATTRLGRKTKYTLGPVRFVNSINKEDFLCDYQIVRIEVISFCDIDNELARLENFENSKQLKNKLKKIYGEIKESDTMTVIEWER